MLIVKSSNHLFFLATLFLLLAVLSPRAIAAASTAATTPEDADDWLLQSQTNNHDKTRDLALLGNRCQSRLSKCSGPQDLPVEEWLDQIRKQQQAADNNTDEDSAQPATLRSVDLLVVTIQDIQETDFSTIMANPPKRGSLRAAAPLRSILNDLQNLRRSSNPSSQQDDNNLETTLQAALVVATRLQDAMARTIGGENNLDSLQSVLDIVRLLIRLYLAIQGGPITILIFVLRLVIDYLLSTTRNVALLTMFPNWVDADCTGSLLQCEYNDLMSNVIPLLIDEVSTSDAMSPP